MRQKGFWIMAALSVMALSIILPYGEALKLNLISNTDRCVYVPALQKDWCNTVYSLDPADNPGLGIYSPEKAAFIFKTDRNNAFSTAISGLEYTLKAETKGGKTIINITAYKNPFENIDNVFCYSGECDYSKVWWNSSFLYRYNITIQNLNATDFIYANWTINISANTINVSDGNCSDVVITHNVTPINASYINITDCNSTASQIWFPLQKDLNAVLLNDTDYFLYLGSAEASAPRIVDNYKLWLIPAWLGDSVTAFYPMQNNNIEILDDVSRYNNDGAAVVAGGKSFSTSGCIFGQCVSFDGPQLNKEYSIPYTGTALDTGTGNFFISVWVNPQACTVIHNQSTIADWRYGASEYGGQFIIDDGCNINFNLNGPGAGSLGCNSPKRLPLNRWTHIIAMGNESGINLWINGYNQLCGDPDTGQGDLFLTDGAIHIGDRFDAGYEGDLDGSIDDLIWGNTSLTGAQIDKMFNDPFNPPTFVFGMAYNGTEGVYIPPYVPPVAYNYTLNYTTQFCYNDNFLYRTVRDISANGTMVFNSYLEECKYGCYNFTIWTLGNPGCAESPLVQFAYLAAFFIIIFMILYVFERSR